MSWDSLSPSPSVHLSLSPLSLSLTAVRNTTGAQIRSFRESRSRTHIFLQREDARTAPGWPRTARLSPPWWFTVSGAGLSPVHLPERSAGLKESTAEARRSLQESSCGTETRGGEDVDVSQRGRVKVSLLCVESVCVLRSGGVSAVLARQDGESLPVVLRLCQRLRDGDLRRWAGRWGAGRHPGVDVHLDTQGEQHLNFTARRVHEQRHGVGHDNPLAVLQRDTGYRALRLPGAPQAASTGPEPQSVGVYLSPGLPRAAGAALSLPERLSAACGRGAAARRA